MDLIIKNARVLTAKGMQTADVAIRDGLVVRIGPSEGAPPCQTISADSKILLPGGIDPHVHLELLTGSGQTSSDDFASGSRAALFGGVTSLGDFVYPRSGQRLIAALRERRAAIRERCLCHCFLHVAISENPPDLEEQIDECVEAGTRSFKVHLNDPRVTAVFLGRICRHLARCGSLLLVHAEKGAEIERRIKEMVRAGKLQLSSHPVSRPPELEAKAVKQACALAQRYGTKIYLVHLSTRLGLETVRRYREKGAPVFVETCPQYLLLTEEKYREAEGYCFTCSPPFRREADRLSLWEGLQDGSIDTVATDHCPFWKVQKDTWKGDFTRLPFGIPGVETMIPLFFSEGRKRGLSYEKLCALVSTNAARIFGLSSRRGEIRPGAAADLFLYDPGRVVKLDYRRLHMNCDFSPYQGMKINGYPALTICGGKVWTGGGSSTN